jgi:NAD+ diphosphatase
MPYPEQINLPFNFSYIRDAFEFRHPSDPEPPEGGFWAIMQGNGVLLIEEGDSLTLPQGDLPVWLTPKNPPLCIGLWHGKPLRAFTITGGLPLQPPFTAEPFNAAEQRLDMQTLTLTGLAKQILHWERQSRHCPRCGALTERIAGSWGKKCTACASEHFPHIHPCAIVLVKRGGELLLTRKPEWPPGRYSLVAGFLDFGESLEECAFGRCVRRPGSRSRTSATWGARTGPFRPR